MLGPENRFWSLVSLYSSVCIITVKNKADYFTDFAYHGFFLERNPRDKRGFTVPTIFLTVVYYDIKYNFILQDTESLEELVLAITVTPKPGTSATESPKDIGIVIEGVQVITDVGSIARACSILLGLTYVLNLDYPKQLKYAFEVFQKLFMELDASKLSNKVQSLKGKLLS